MKKRWILKQAMAVLLFTSPLFADDEIILDENAPVILSVKEKLDHSRTKERKGEVAKWPYFSIYRDMKTKTCELNIDVLNQTGEELSCQLEWYFMVDRTIDKETEPERMVVSPGKKQLTIPPEKTVEQTTSKRFEYARIVIDEFKKFGSQNIDRREYYEGDEYVGYIVLVTASGEILARTASNTWMLDQKWIEKCRAVTF
jgi:hypothetical protein